MNRIEIAIEEKDPQNWAKVANAEARAEAKRRGIEWIDADVFVRLPQRGRCFTKQAGFVTLGAHG